MAKQKATNAGAPGAPKRKGPKLVEPAHMLAIRQRLADQGFTSFKDAAKKTNVHFETLIMTCRLGLSDDPRQRVVDALKDLGIFDLVPKRRAAS